MCHTAIAQITFNPDNKNTNNREYFAQCSYFTSYTHEFQHFLVGGGGWWVVVDGSLVKKSGGNHWITTFQGGLGFADHKTFNNHKKMPTHVTT